MAALPAALLIAAPASSAGASTMTAAATGQASVHSSRTVQRGPNAAVTGGVQAGHTTRDAQVKPGTRKVSGGHEVRSRPRAVPRPAGAPLSAAWRTAYHPRHASKGVLALRGEPLRASTRPGSSGVIWQHQSAFFRPMPTGSRVQLRPQQCTLPGAPGSVTATAGANQAAVTWTAANGNGNTITAYVLREATGPQTGASIATGGSATSATLTGLAGGTAATFSVVAETTCGTGPAGTSGSASPTGSATTYVSAVQGSTPVAFYRLAEPAGTTVMADSSGNSADGAYSGQATLGEPAALLNDPATSANYTSCCSGIGSGSPVLPQYANSRTVSAWFNTTSGTTNMALAGYGPTTTNEAFIVSLSAHSINVDGYNDYLSFPTPRPANDGNWHMVAVTYNGTNVVVYLDGQQIGSSSFAGTINTLDPSGMEVGYFPGYNAFSGDEADVAVFGSALSPATVASQFSASGYSAPTAPNAVNVFTGGANAADVTWGHATAGGSIQGYLVSALGSASGTPSVAVSGDATAARVTGLAAGTYTFRVVALNAYGSGPAGTTKSFAVTGTASTYVSTVLSSSPSVFYRMGDSTRYVMSDSSGNAATGAYTTLATLGQTGPLASDPSSAIDVTSNGPAAGASPALPLYASPRTIEGWVNTTSTSEQFVASYGETNTTEGFDLVEEPHAVIVSGYNDDLSFTSPAALDDGSWHFITATTNGTSATVYVDGKNLGTQNFPTTLNTIAAPQGLVVAMGPEDCCGYFNGDLADLAVFPTALSAATVTAQFAASGLGPASAPGSPTATVGANQSTVSWTAPGTADPAVTGYLVTAYAGTTAGNAVSVPATATSTVMTGLAGGTAYTFQIQALNEYGAGAAATTAAVTPTGTSSTYDSTTQSDGPSVFYRMADTDQLAMADSSGNGATGAYSTGATLGETGPLASDPATAINDGGCCNTAGSGNPALPGYGQPRTLESWIKTTTGGTQYVAGYGVNSTDEGFDLIVQPNAVIVSGYNDDLSFATPTMITDGSWHLITASTNGSSATVYLDGVSLGTQNFPAALDTLSASQGLVVGMGAEDCCGYFNGGLADLAVFGSALTAAQVTAQFTASGLAVPGAPTAPTATAGTNQANVSWTAPSKAADPAVSGYLVTAYKGTAAGDAVSVPATSTSTTVTGLVGGAAYKFKIQALNEYGAGAAATTAAVTPTGSASTYVSTVLAASPSVFYRLADGDSHAMADSSGNAATGAYTSQATLGEPGPLASDPVTAISDAGCCAAAAGGDPSLPLYASPRSLEAWVNTTSTSQQYLAGYGQDNTGEGFDILVGPHAVTVSGYNNDLTFTSAVALNDGSWHFITATTTGTSATVYVDGVSLGTQNFGAALNTLPASQGLVIGMGAEDCCGYFSGDIADLAVFPSALTSTQVTSEFTASGLGPAAAPGSPAATAGANQATVSWTAPPQSNPAYTGFLVSAYKGSAAVNAVTVPATSTSTTVTGLVSGGSYKFKIQALNEYGAGAAATTAVVTPTGSASTYVSTVLASNPSVFYRLADTDTHAMADSSGNGATGGAYGNTTTLGQTGPLGNDSATALSDTGCCSQIASGNPSLPVYASARTEEFWMNTTNTGELYETGYGTASTDEGFNLVTEPNTVIVSGYSDDVSFSTKAPLNDGSWHFVAVTATATSATVYVDGVSLGTQNFPSPLDTLPATQGLVLGMASQDCCGYFYGNLADVAVFPAALSASAISAQFAASGLGAPGAPTSPTATAGANQATVSWTAPTGSNPAVNGYLVTAFKGSTAVNAVSVPATTASTTVTGLVGSVAYTFQIQALNEYGAGAAATTAAVSPTGTASTYDSTVLSAKPSVFYRLADTDAHAMADSSGNGATGVYGSTATLGQTGPLANDIASSISDSGCCAAAGAGAGASLPFYNSSRTFEGWIKTTNGGEEYLGGYGSSSTNEAFNVATEPNNVIVSGYSDDLSFTTTTSLDNGSWHFVVVTTNGTTATVYVDGASQGTQTFPTPLDTVPSPQGLVIGMFDQDCCGYFYGNLADVAVFPSVLTATQVSAEYTASGDSGSRKHKPTHITVPQNHPAPGGASPSPHSRPAHSLVTGGRS